jgi:hypothetical protein
MKLWTDAAKLAADAMVETAEAIGENNERLLWESAEAVARGFRGREIEVDLGGSPLRGEVSSIELRPGSEHAARIELVAVRFEGMSIPTVEVVAEEVEVTPPPDLGLSLSNVEMRGSVPLRELVAWVDRTTPRWALGVTDQNLLRAVSADGVTRLVLEPSLAGDHLELEVREVSWRGVGLKVPRWLRLTRRPPLPPLPGGMSLIQAHRRDRDVDLTLAVSDLQHSLDLSTVLGR